MTLNGAHWHLLLNHLPILGSGFVLFLLAWGLARRSREVTQLALWLTLPLALAALLADQTGDAAKHALRDAPWVERTLVHEHEERADLAEIALYATTVMGALALWRSRRHADERWPAALTLALLVIAALLAAWTGLAGGVIRHDEIRPAAAAGN